MFFFAAMLLGLNSIHFAVDPRGSSFSNQKENTNKAIGLLHVSNINLRYFENENGNIIYLTGSHTWASLQDAGYSSPPPAFDYNAYLDFLQSHNHNFFRLWTWEQTRWAPWAPGDIWFSPSPFQRTGPGNALDGNPKFNLTKFNQAYFDLMRSRIIEAGNRGVYVSVMLFDGWSVGEEPADNPGNPWPGNPFNASNNINGINGDPNNDGNGYEVHDLSIPELTILQDAYVRKVIDTVNDLDNVLYEICNECDGDSTAWQYHMVDLIHEYEKTLPKQHPVGMTAEYPNGDNADLFASNAEWISPNDYADPPASDGSKVIISDTDHIWGLHGDRRWAWESFTRGLNPIFMDCYNSNYCEGENPKDPDWVSLRENLGYILEYANRVDLAKMTPLTELCSTGYCLANPVGEGAEYLVYIPNGGSVDVDLSDSPINLSVEWFNPQSGTTVNASSVIGGDTQTFTVPFSGDAVLYIYNISAPTPTSTITPTSPSLTPTQTNTMVPATATSTPTPPAPTPAPPSSSLPCAQGFLALGGVFFVMVRSGSLRGKNNKRL